MNKKYLIIIALLVFLFSFFFELATFIGYIQTENEKA